MLARPSIEQQLRNELEIAAEENRQLRDQIARLSGRDRIQDARRAFGFTEAEATIFCLILRQGLATYRMLEDAVYPDAAIEALACPSCAIRTHMKRIRQKTRPYGIDFKTIYSLGFEIEPDMQAKARAALAAKARA